MFRNFGRKIFGLYEAYPITMNSIAGATVYCGGEVFVQVTGSEGMSAIDPRKLTEITVLGAFGTFLQ